MIYAVIDTNVIVSALLTRNAESSTVKVIEALLCGKIVPLYNEEIIREYIDVLNRPKFRYSPSLVQRFIEAWTELGVNALRIHSNEYFPNSSDAVFYEITLSKRGAYLVTGNKKHFPQSPIVVSPAEMLTIMGEMAQ